MHAIKHNEISRYGSVALCAAIAGLALFGIASASGQIEFSGIVQSGANGAIQPSHSVIHTFSDEAGIRIYSTNMRSSATAMSLSVKDQNLRPISATVMPSAVRLDARDTGEFVVIVPMRDNDERRFHVCASYSDIVEFGQCGSYLARRAG